MKKLTALLLTVLIVLVPALAESALSDRGAILDEDVATILDGRWLCIDLQGNVTEDTPAELVDDFDLYVNKPWILQAKIPDGESVTCTSTETLRILKDRQITLMKDESLAGHDAELVRKLYALISDWDYRNALGVTPAMPIMKALRAIESLEDVMDYLRSAAPFYNPFPLIIEVAPDYLDPDIYIVHIQTPDLLFKDSAEYAERTQLGELYDALNRQLGGYMLQRLGCDEANETVENAFSFEAMLAEHIKPLAAQYEADYAQSLLNYYSPEELQVLAGDFPIMDMIMAYGIQSGKRILVEEPDYIAALGGLYTEENAVLIRDWMMLNAALNLYDKLDQQTEREARAIINAAQGATGEVSEDDNALDTLTSALPVPMDNLYIQAYCTEKQREDILAIISDAVAYYREMLSSEDWLSEETRAKAIEKLDNMRVRAVYPDTLGDWSGLDFAGPGEGGTLLAAINAAKVFSVKLKSDRVGTAVDRDAWDQVTISTAQVNAYYDAQNNSINILAGMLNGEIYNEDMHYEQILGGIGTIIGHEISHAFDTDGAQFDKDGAIANWWTDEDYAAFQSRAAKLAAWYDGFIPAEGITYSGKQVQGEAIADMGGMKCMLGIAAQREDFDYDLFFRQNATLYREKELPSLFILQASIDVHPLCYLRVNATLAQFEEFLDFYGIKEGDGMYLAPEDRVAVW